jgi:hypothetical protein
MTTESRSRRPIKLRQGDLTNYHTLLAAAKNGDLALVSSIRVTDGADVALLSAVNRYADGSIHFAPLAVMVEDDPYQLYLGSEGTYTPPARCLSPSRATCDRCFR